MIISMVQRTTVTMRRGYLTAKQKCFQVLLKQ